MPKPLLITPGDPAGIGPDLVLLSGPIILAQTVIIADPALLESRAVDLNLTINIKILKSLSDFAEDPTCLQVYAIPLATPAIAGQPNPANASYTLKCLEFAANACLNHEARGLVTGPINKAVINEATLPFTGHTGYLAYLAKTPDVVMMLAGPTLRVALLTEHVALTQVPALVTSERLRVKVSILHHVLQTQFHIAKPKIAVCGLNPHAGDGGYLGREEIDVIIPTLLQLQKEGFEVSGPFAADTLFTPEHAAPFDVILAMYHDQGLAPLKAREMGQIVNITLGLPFVRTSVDHGTAYDLAGTGRIEISSFESALNQAELLSQRRDV